MSANVRDFEAILDFRAALVTFVEEAESTLQMMHSETQRLTAWIEQDRPHYWKMQTQRAFDQVASARSAYDTCRMKTVAGHRSSCIEEQQALQKAKNRLAHCQEQIEQAHRWANKIRHQIDEFRGRIAGFQRLLSSDIPQGIALLEKTVQTLESYAEIQRQHTTEGE